MGNILFSGHDAKIRDFVKKGHFEHLLDQLTTEDINKFTTMTEFEFLAFMDQDKEKDKIRISDEELTVLFYRIKYEIEAEMKKQKDLRKYVTNHYSNDGLALILTELTN